VSKKRNISILGTGWLGLELAKYLAEKGFLVKGSVTGFEKFSQFAQTQILPFQVSLTDTEAVVNDTDFFQTEVLIICIPPKRVLGIEQIYPAQMQNLIPFIRKSGIQKVIFISSTSVYPEHFQNAVEDFEPQPDKESGKACLLAENLLKEHAEFKTTIIRFGGLIGADRNPARFLLKSSLPIANIPVNLIHRNDCIGIISAIIDKELWGETFNACCPEHPMKKDFYGKAARISGLPEPVFSNEIESYKMVDSSKLLRLLQYKFEFASPMDYLDCLETSKEEKGNGH
jgi:nucleoside-diphosphate-sugar epimerase